MRWVSTGGIVAMVTCFKIDTSVKWWIWGRATLTGYKYREWAYLYPLKQGYIELFGAKNSDIAMARAKRHYIPGQIWHTPVKQGEKRFNGVNYSSGYAFGLGLRPLGFACSFGLRPHKTTRHRLGSDHTKQLTLPIKWLKTVSKTALIDQFPP